MHKFCLSEKMLGLWAFSLQSFLHATHWQSLLCIICCLCFMLLLLANRYFLCSLLSSNGLWAISLYCSIVLLLYCFIVHFLFYSLLSIHEIRFTKFFVYYLRFGSIAFALIYHHHLTTEINQSLWIFFSTKRFDSSGLCLLCFA